MTMPSWLQKLGKHDRDRSSSISGRSPSPSSASTGGRSRTASLSFSRSSHGTPSVNVIPPVPTRGLPSEMGELPADNSQDASRDESPGPSVTVVPPSPANTLDNTSLPSDNSSPESKANDSQSGKKRQNLPPNLETSIEPEPMDMEDIATPKANTVSGKPTLLASHPVLRREASDTSLLTRPNKDSKHGRTATTPAPLILAKPSGEDFLVDSPEADSPPVHEKIPSDNTISPVPPEIPKPQRADTATTIKNTRKPSWGRSNKRKPTGLAAAIASSSLAMANPHGGNMTIPQPMPKTTTKKDGDQPPTSSSILAGSSKNQAKQASLSTGALPFSRETQGFVKKAHSHQKSSSGEAPVKHTRRSTTSSSPGHKKKANRRVATEYTPGGGDVPPVPSVKGASKSTPGLYGLAAASASMLGLSPRSREESTSMTPPGRPAPLISPQSSKKSAGYSSGPDALPSGASSVGDWTTSDDAFDDSESEDETSSEESDDVDKELAGLDLGEEPSITGFAVASSRRNQEFHDLFTTVPEADYLIDDYGCALQREILIQGRLYVSENHVCFHANIFGWITDLSIPVFEITSIEKKMTAFVIPNALQITTRRAKYTFASLLARDTTSDVIFNVWRSARTGSDPGAGLDSSLQISEAVVNGSTEPTGTAEMPNGGSNADPVRKATRCMCGIRGEHYSETAMEIVIPGTPERIYNLIFASGFIKDFLRGEQKLLDLQISDWTPVNPGSNLLTRNMSYIKPLNGSIGPRQTKCEISDEVVYCDFDDYMSTISTTRTPDVPSGGVFSVKTRTCIMWASAVSTRVIVTTQVEWTGRSFIKGIIERSCIDGQKTFHADLDRCMRTYIQEHQSEFIPEGVDLARASAQAVEESAHAEVGIHEEMAPPSGKQREHERNERAMQWAYDTFAGAARVAGDSTKGAFELISDAWDQSSSTTILWFAIVVLVISNLATFFGGSRSMRDVKNVPDWEYTAGAPKVVLPPVHQPRDLTQDWVKDVVREIWDEMKVLQAIPLVPVHQYPSPHGSSVGELKLEVQALLVTLDDVEKRITELRLTLGTLESQENASYMRNPM